MRKEQLDKLTRYIVDKYMLNVYDYILYNKDEYSETSIELFDAIASLRNLLYKEVTGKNYDYMFHLCNKCGYNEIDDDILYEILDMKFEDIKKEV